MTEGVTHQKNSIHSRLLAWRGTVLSYKDQRQSLIARSFRWPDLQASFFRHGMNIVCKVKLVFGSTGRLGRSRRYTEEGFSSKTALLCGDVCAFVCFFVCRKKWNQENTWVSDTFFIFFPSKNCYFILLTFLWMLFFPPFKMWRSNALISFLS